MAKGKEETLATIYSKGKIGFRTHHRVEAVVSMQAQPSQTLPESEIGTAAN